MAEEQLTNQEQPEFRRGPGRPRKIVDVVADIVPQAAAPDIVTIRASIVGVGFKTTQCARWEVEKFLERVGKIGFPVDNGHGTVTYYLSSRIEKLDVVG
jgi:hypothetical protein